MTRHQQPGAGAKRPIDTIHPAMLRARHEDWHPQAPADRIAASAARSRIAQERAEVEAAHGLHILHFRTIWRSGRAPRRRLIGGISADGEPLAAPVRSKGMTFRTIHATRALAPALALAPLLLLAACNDRPAPDNGSEAMTQEKGPNPLVDIDPASPADNAAEPASREVLTLKGLGALVIGEPVPAGSGWGEHGAQASDTCRIVTSPDVTGVYAIVEGDKVRRISIGQRASVKLVNGIGVGTSEKAVRDAYPAFLDTPHKYVDAPAKYLTAPDADSGDAALRFEIGADGNVSQIHVGTMPTLGYIEACS